MIAGCECERLGLVRALGCQDGVKPLLPAAGYPCWSSGWKSSGWKGRELAKARELNPKP